MATPRTPSERFWEKVNKDGPIPEWRPDLGPCWCWTAADDGHGYGRFDDTKAYAWAWVEANGPVPEGLELDHLCRVKLCVRPSHMEPVTHGENISRSTRARATCRKGHDLADAAIRKRDGARICRICQREWNRDWEQRKREGAGPQKPGPKSSEPSRRRYLTAPPPA